VREIEVLEMRSDELGRSAPTYTNVSRVRDICEGTSGLIYGIPSVEQFLGLPDKAIVLERQCIRAFPLRG
jgi:hypothetical protein